MPIPAATRGGTAFLRRRNFAHSSSRTQAGDYRLTPNSVWRGAGTDGRDLGASFDAAAADRSFLARPKEG
jgi:hypothetical protein